MRRVRDVFEPDVVAGCHHEVSSTDFSLPEQVVALPDPTVDRLLNESRVPAVCDQLPGHEVPAQLDIAVQQVQAPGLRGRRLPGSVRELAA